MSHGDYYNNDDIGAPDPLDEANWFERSVHFHGLNKAVIALLRHPNDKRDWAALRRFVVDKPYAPEHMEAYLAMRGEHEPGNSVLASAIEVGAEGKKQAEHWAVAVLGLKPAYARELAGESDWLRRVFDDSTSSLAVDLMRDNHSWAPLWKTMATRWQGREVIRALDALPPEHRAREYLGVGIVRQLGGRHIVWNLEFIDAVNRCLNGALTLQPNLTGPLEQPPFMGKLVAAVHKSVLGQVAGNDDHQPHDPGSRPRI